ncbi:Metallo-beta-lactamase superfamily protein [Chryseobacterium taeanense]|uniref:Metallo-beta-lactamase superfamily protein n=1 Tax=Chryseobacterium taeanense TaxID=311334 RepID=A0A1G8EFE9_9FLAO|nr:MBL fold metallo-hydrolase [Chryseobacterium taeanense]SDH68606.1 Metallo-beta-lactamase superfamily protein [Chryseobacterium taeanense]
MESEFIFFKAGQGSFYGGRIWLHKTNQVYTVVYDCGTSPFIAGNSQSLNNEISYFKNMHHNFLQNNNEIELLFISHLDYDHVSGLKRLLKEFQVKNIILPYIKKEHRKFFLISIFENNDPDNNLTIDEYISFIESPHQFIAQNSDGTKQFYIKPNSNNEIEYQDYDNSDNQSVNIYPRGTQNTDIIELVGQPNVFVYENNLQFFIKRNWEFTTFAKNVSETAIDKLHNCLKSKLNKKTADDLSFEDLKNIVLVNRKETHKCYTECIGDINSHGLVLLHGPIRFQHLCGDIYSNCELNYFRNYCPFYDYHHFNSNNRSMLGTLLLGDTSLNPNNNPIVFPKAFKDKLVNVHIVQVPHHGSSKNWDLVEFAALNIGDNISRWGNHVVAVCNFGYGNKFGHPSHHVLNDLCSTIFLNSQFSRLNIRYDIYFKFK